jgi:RecA/RadA recombinase
MAKKKVIDEANEMDEIFYDLVNECDGTLLDDLGPSKYYVDTGNLALNYICAGKCIGGGVPGGKITEIYGPPASSKSLIGMCILHGVQKMGGFAIFLDLERAANRDFSVKAAHVNPKQLVVYEPDTIETSFLKIHNVIKLIREKKGPDIPIVVVYDSIGAVPCDREMREIDLPEGYTKAQFEKIVGSKEKPGERARISGKELRKMNPVLARQNASLVIINQTRQKLNVMFGRDVGGAGGGKALEFFGSCKLWVNPQKKIVKKLTEKLNIPLGVNVKIKNEKNRSFDPFWETDNVQLYFRNGINPLGGLLGILIKAERIKSTSAGNYEVLEPFNGGKEVKFRSSMERNDVPVEVLLECPALIDGENREQVEAYLSTFGSAITLSDADAVVEDDMTDDEILGGIGDE